MDQRFLRRGRPRHGDAVGVAVLVDGAAADDRVNRIVPFERLLFDSGFRTTTPAPSARP